MEIKALGPATVLDAPAGKIEAVFATLNVKDHQGDLTLPSAFETGAPVKISAYNHLSNPFTANPVRGMARPVGKGMIAVEGNDVKLRGQYFMDVPAARDDFLTVVGLGDLAEWSYGYDPVGHMKPTEEQAKAGVRRVLTKLAVYEVSPVLLGAGVGTRTVLAKGRDEQPIHELGCPKCRRLLGESSEELICVGEVASRAAIKFRGPRDVRQCKGCGAWSLFVPVATLTQRAG